MRIANIFLYTGVVTFFAIPITMFLFAHRAAETSSNLVAVLFP